jgi:preprotein translocase subunit YajC
MTDTVYRSIKDVVIIYVFFFFIKLKREEKKRKEKKTIKWTLDIYLKKSIAIAIVIGF